MPDLFHGDPVPLNSDMATFSVPTWLSGVYGEKKVPHTPPSIDPIVKASIAELREKYNCKVSMQQARGTMPDANGRRNWLWQDTASAPNMSSGS